VAHSARQNSLSAFSSLTLFSFLSVLIGAKLAGFWGLILAIPVAVALLELADDVEKDKVLSRTE
jgi:predicted PurR-regulated permease PerM